MLRELSRYILIIGGITIAGAYLWIGWEVYFRLRDSGEGALGFASAVACLLVTLRLLNNARKDWREE